MGWQKWPKDTISDYEGMHIHTRSCIYIRKGFEMIILNIVGVAILVMLWKMERNSVEDRRDMDTVSAFLLPLMIAVSICWIFFDLIFMILG